MVRETHLRAEDMVLPLFITEGSGVKEEIPSMPGCYRYSVENLLKKAEEALEVGIRGIALFPKIREEKKDSLGSFSWDEENFYLKAISELKEKLPELIIFTDVAMDPYSSDGHDGIVKDGIILNDETLDVLGKMALAQAKAGADFIAPSDMMDGRVGYLRSLLDENNFKDVGIMAYSAKYASSFYGPFRDALESAPKAGNKKTYQMDPANRTEAIREVRLDLEEGADMVMIKPALSYLDIISDVKKESTVPVCAYFVSGEYSMIMAAGEKGWLNAEDTLYEATLSVKRAGADIIFTYGAIELAKRNLA
ncbi:MAG: porphobilinogen synthase [Bacteriovoracaceae bacterium]|jgi:porphobilinogen synthase